MENGKLYGAENDFGVIVNGKYFPCEWMTEFVNFISENVITKHLSEMKVIPDKEKFYSVKEICTATGLHESTITKHIRLGILKASKPGGGKSWLITEENYRTYIQNSHRMT